MAELARHFRINAGQGVTDTRLGLAALAMFTAAGILLLDHRSLWLDELFTIDFAAPDASLHDALTERMATDRSPPLYYILVHLWMALFGNSAVALRSVNLIGIGVLAVAMVYSRTRPWVGHAWLPFWLLALTSRFSWDFLTEGRAYFLLFSGAALLSVQLGELIYSMETGTPVSRRLLGFIALTAFLLGGLHYFGLLFAGSAILILFVFALHKRYRPGVTAFAVTGGVMLAAAAAWILHTMPKIKVPPSGRFWLDFDPPKAVSDFIIYTFSSNLVLLALMGVAAYGAWRILFKEMPVKGLIALGLVTFGVTLIISLKQPLLFYRYLIVLAPPLLMIVARLLALAPQRWVLPAALVSALVISLPVAIVKSLPSREDWRSAADYVETHFGGRCERAIMMAAPVFEDFAAHRYYERGRDWTFLPLEQGAVDAVLASPCPVLAWAGHLDPREFEAAFAALDWKGTPVEVVRFGLVYLVVRK